MVVLNINYEHRDIDKKVLPFFCYRIFIDTSVLKIYFEGIIRSKYEKKRQEDYESLLKIFRLLKIEGRWNKFWITPHILTEICRQIYSQYREGTIQYKRAVEMVLPILSKIKEEGEITKEKIMAIVDADYPVIKMGDLSLFVSIDQFINESKKVAIIVKDDEFNERYAFHPNVMIVDFKQTTLDLLAR